MDETEATAVSSAVSGMISSRKGARPGICAAEKVALILSTGVQVRICKAKRRGSADELAQGTAALIVRCCRKSAVRKGQKARTEAVKVTEL